MKTIRILLLIVTVVTMACNSKQLKTAETKTDSTQNSIKANNSSLPGDSSNASKPFIDTFKRFEVDDYPVSYDMLKCNDNSSTCEIKYKDLVSLEKIWFRNDSLQQSLVFEMYTDGFRVAIFHFNNNDIPAALIQKMELHTARGDIAAAKYKLNNFRGFIPLAKKISPQYFRSTKGIELGDAKEKIIKLYGKPGSFLLKNGVEIYSWAFAGDLLYDGKEKLNGRPLAKDNYGHQATMFFKKNRLIALVLENDIP